MHYLSTFDYLSESLIFLKPEYYSGNIALAVVVQNKILFPL